MKNDNYDQNDIIEKNKMFLEHTKEWINIIEKNNLDHFCRFPYCQSNKMNNGFYCLFHYVYFIVIDNPINKRLIGNKKELYKYIDFIISKFDKIRNTS